LAFHLDVPAAADTPDLGQNGHLRLIKREGGGSVRITSITVSEGEGAQPPRISGHVKGHFMVGTGSILDHVVFHLVNCADYHGSSIQVSSPGSNKHWLGRVRLQAKQWTITIDSIPRQRTVLDPLDVEGGFAITHIGRLEAANGEPFSSDDAEEVLGKWLFHFLSFVRGARVNAILPVGFDSDGNRVWEQWSSPVVDPWTGPQRSWFSRDRIEGLEDGFRLFVERWMDRDWRDPLVLALHWYCLANRRAAGMEASVVLSQMALETMSWACLVENSGTVSERGFRRLQASDQIGLLMRQTEISLDVPSQLVDLRGYATEENCSRGPDALTSLRNAFVHPSKKKRERALATSNLVPHQAVELAVWYIELALLWVIGYQGRYHNRITAKAVAEAGPVPWANTDESTRL